MPDTIEISDVIPASPQQVYEAWLDSKGHSDMTRSECVLDPAVGGKFTAFDGYISGTTVERKAYSRIVQDWRTREFPEESPDSRLYVSLEAVKGGTKVTLLHTEIPDGQGERYRKGWAEHYFEQMKSYFSS